MHLRRRIIGTALMLGLIGHAALGDGKKRDYATLTCGGFLNSGKDNMAVILWWLRGYHAGKTGSVRFDAADSYAARLGFYCGNHRPDNLIESSERILADLDRGI